jgi:hypothetical protein
VIVITQLVSDYAKLQHTENVLLNAIRSTTCTAILICGSNSGDYEESCLPGRNDVQSG